MGFEHSGYTMNILSGAGHELEETSCSYSCRHESLEKGHRRKLHGFAADKRRGGSGRDGSEEIEEQTVQNSKKVICQRLSP